MAKAAWFSHDQPQLIDDPAARTVLSKPGNWLQGQGGEPLVEARYIYSWRVDSGPWSAPSRDLAQFRNDNTGLFDPQPGEGQASFSYASLPPGTHRLDCQVSAATHSVYVTQDGQTAYDAYEWGTGNVTDPTLPLVSHVDVVVPEPVPPPALPAASFDVSRLERIRSATIAEENQAKATYATWRTQNPGEAGKVDAYLAAVADGGTPQPPVLVTHRGRGVSGLLQAGAGVLGRLPT